MTARVMPGPWLAIARPSCWALLDLPADDPRLAALEQAASAGAPVDALLDVLLAGGLRAAPGFVVVARTSTSLRYAVRHPAALRLDGVAIEPAAGTSWTDNVLTRLPGAATLLAGGAGAAGAGGGAGSGGAAAGERPLDQGVTAAGRVRISWSTDEISQSAVPTGPLAPSASLASSVPELIDGVPWASDASEPTGSSEPTGPMPPGPPPSAPRYDAPGATHLREAARQDHTVQRPAPRPMVWATRCTRGHLTPPYAPMCRVCGTPVPEQQPVQVPRPVLGRLVLSTGGVITLDRSVVLGRSPQPPPTEPDAQLVRVTTATEVSRSHAEVRLEDWHVFLRDLGSANGTLLTLPDHQPQQLRPHEDHHLEHGCTVSLADVVGFRYEVTE